MVSVSDAGVGIPKSNISRVIEPFFTTKEGKGTGLDLSMVYGFVKQSGGHMNISSESERGTVVKLYFPESSDRLPTVNPQRQSNRCAAMAKWFFWSRTKRAFASLPRPC
jgi:K+-sensing histidine kinase KdpD